MWKNAQWLSSSPYCDISTTVLGAVPSMYMGAQLQIIDTKTHNIDNKEGGN